MRDHDEFDISAIDRAFDVLEEEIEDGLRASFREASKRTAETAKANHPWQSRSGDMEGAIKPIEPTGRALAGTLQAGVVIAVPYASYLEGHDEYGPGIGNGAWQSLNPAFATIEPSWERDSQGALDHAADRAGLR
jgi:hypothetical protein